jgi:hypothetical protein
MFSDFAKFVELPKSTAAYWNKKKPFPLLTFGNDQHGDCTRASQAHMILRMESIEQRRRISINEADVIAAYYDMCERKYGSRADNGAYETDALDDWRDARYTIRDDAGRPYTIDAYLRLNPSNHDEIKAALALSGAKGIKACLNLPAAWANVDPPEPWDVPANQPLLGPWMAGTWGGHSVALRGYDERGVYMVDTWGQPDRHITWEGMSAYCDEAHMVMDSMNAWRKAKVDGIKLNVNRVVEAVNDVSSIRIGSKR